MLSDQAIRNTIVLFLNQRGDDKTICPSEVARSLSPADWRPLMSSVRDVGWQMSEEGLISITQKGELVNRDVKGPVRLGKRR